jgi:hypothetical protein
MSHVLFVPTGLGSGHFVRDYRICRWLALHANLAGSFLATEGWTPADDVMQAMQRFARWHIAPHKWLSDARERRTVLDLLRSWDICCVIGDFLGRWTVPLAHALKVPCILLLQPFTYDDELFWVRPLLDQVQHLVVPCTPIFGTPDVDDELADRLTFVGPLLDERSGPTPNRCGVAFVGAADDHPFWRIALEFARVHTRERITFIGTKVTHGLTNVMGLGFQSDVLPLLRQIEVVVTRAGYNTLMEALSSSCHIVAMPFAGHREQEHNARRLLQLHACAICTEDTVNGVEGAIANARCIPSDDLAEARRILIGSGDGVAATGRLIMSTLGIPIENAYNGFRPMEVQCE